MSHLNLNEYELTGMSAIHIIIRMVEWGRDRECHGFVNPCGLGAWVHTGMGTGWDGVTLTQPTPVTRVWRVLHMNATFSMGIRCCPANIGRQRRRQTLPLYSTCGVDPQKKMHRKKYNHIYQNHIPHPKPTPMDSPEASGPRKCKLSTKVTTNGDPEVERKRKKLEAKKQSTKAAPTQKHSSTQAPAKTKTTTKAAAKPAPQQRRPSIEIEEIEDEADYHTSVPPRNPQHILEAADGSDDDVDTTAPPWKSTTSTKKPVNTK